MDVDNDKKQTNSKYSNGGSYSARTSAMLKK